jgi:hypothetical protein
LFVNLQTTVLIHVHARHWDNPVNNEPEPAGDEAVAPIAMAA